ncbi:MAG: enoyl-CoA hydratase/isomerase family protein [Chloroflexi bacterium]|nr:enoyl-CoA hydratase/isomerase family protein [Chloroflexota bacterium]MYI04770.1 enoyl-CoA hydratase/isomerase family protein [Chloroflexota bacterium]
MAETIATEQVGRVARIALNRPEKLNAISRQLQRELIEALTEAEHDDGVHVALVSGAGRAFSAGYDLAGGSGVAAEQASAISHDRDGLEDLLRNWLKIWDLRLPVVAKVHGHCLAGGTQLATICDVTFVADDARVGAPQLPLGAGFVASFWAWQVGAKRAKEFFFPVGSMISGAEAAEIGLFNRSLPADQLDQYVDDYVELVAKTPKEILVLQKRAINRTQEVQGFREALMGGVEIDSIAHFTNPILEMNRSLKERGLRATLDDFHRQE